MMNQRFPFGRMAGITLVLPALLTACQPPMATQQADPAPAGTAASDIRPTEPATPMRFAAGLALNPDGTPRANALVSLETIDGSQIVVSGIHADANGRFVIPIIGELADEDAAGALVVRVEGGSGFRTQQSAPGASLTSVVSSATAQNGAVAQPTTAAEAKAMMEAAQASINAIIPKLQKAEQVLQGKIVTVNGINGHLNTLSARQQETGYRFAQSRNEVRQLYDRITYHGQAIAQWRNEQVREWYRATPYRNDLAATLALGGPAQSVEGQDATGQILQKKRLAYAKLMADCTKKVNDTRFANLGWFGDRSAYLSRTREEITAAFYRDFETISRSTPSPWEPYNQLTQLSQQQSATLQALSNEIYQVRDQQSRAIQEREAASIARNQVQRELSSAQLALADAQRLYLTLQRQEAERLEQERLAKEKADKEADDKRRQALLQEQERLKAEQEARERAARDAELRQLRDRQLVVDVATTLWTTMVKTKAPDLAAVHGGSGSTLSPAAVQSLMVAQQTFVAAMERMLLQPQQDQRVQAAWEAFREQPLPEQLTTLTTAVFTYSGEARAAASSGIATINTMLVNAMSQGTALIQPSPVQLGATVIDPPKVMLTADGKATITDPVGRTITIVPPTGTPLALTPVSGSNSGGGGNPTVTLAPPPASGGGGGGGTPGPSILTGITLQPGAAFTGAPTGGDGEGTDD